MRSAIGFLTQPPGCSGRLRLKCCSHPPKGRSAYERPQYFDFPSIKILVDRRDACGRSSTGRRANQIAARRANPVHAAAPVGTERAEPSCTRRHDHVRRAVSRSARRGRTGGRVAGISVCDAHSTCGERRHGRRRFVRNCPRPRRGAARSRRCSRLSRVRLGACSRGVVLNGHAAWRAVRVPLDGRTGRDAVGRARLFERGVRRRRLHLHAEFDGQRRARHRQYGPARHGHRWQCGRAHSHLAVADLRMRTVARPWSGRRRLGLGGVVWRRQPRAARLPALAPLARHFDVYVEFLCSGPFSPTSSRSACQG